MTTSIRELNKLSDRLSGQYDTIHAEWATIPQQRSDAAGNEKLLLAVEARKNDLRVADKIRKEAVANWHLAVEALPVNPDTADTHYAEALKLAAQVQSIIDFRKTKDGDKPTKVEPKTDSPDEDEADSPKGDKPKEEKAEPEPTPAPDRKVAGKKKDEAEPAVDPDAKSDEDEVKEEDEPTDPILAAIAKLGRDCRTGTEELHKEITGVSDRLDDLAKGTLPEELATILRDLNPEAAKVLISLNVDQLNAMLGSTLSPQAREALDVLAAYSREELRTMLANLSRISGNRERVRRALPGSATRSHR